MPKIQDDDEDEGNEQQQEEEDDDKMGEPSDSTRVKKKMRTDTDCKKFKSLRLLGTSIAR